MKTITPSLKVVLSLSLAVGLLVIFSSVLPARSAVPHLGYGFNVAAWDTQRLQNMGFNWIKVFEAPQSPLPQFVLLRVDVNAQTTQTALLDDLDAKLAYKNNIQAWEIGNEVNIDAPYGWNATPDVAAYKSLLCTAYNKIKSQSPNAIVVSAGLAPVGRLSDTRQIDERVFLQQLLATGGGACLDVVGFHPYGYSADYNAVPDIASSDPIQNCDQGFCFRGAEKIYEVMQANGAGDKKMWATEFGWITQPPRECLADSSWKGRAWQIVSPDKQASNLAGAFQYADAHWPWMGAMFVFNLDFNQDPLRQPCDQMRFFSVKGQPAESALANMPKNLVTTLTGKLKTAPPAVGGLVGVSEQPLTPALSIDLSNWGWQPVAYTATADTGAALVPVIANPTGTLSATADIPLRMTLPGFSRTLGIYTGTVIVNWSAPGVNPAVRTVPVQVNVVGQVYRTYLPLLANNTP